MSFQKITVHEWLKSTPSEDLPPPLLSRCFSLSLHIQIMANNYFHNNVHHKHVEPQVTSFKYLVLLDQQSETWIYPVYNDINQIKTAISHIWSDGTREKWLIPQSSLMIHFFVDFVSSLILENKQQKHCWFFRISSLYEDCLKWQQCCGTTVVWTLTWLVSHSWIIPLSIKTLSIL